MKIQKKKKKVNRLVTLRQKRKLLNILVLVMLTKGDGVSLCYLLALQRKSNFG